MWRKLAGGFANGIGFAGGVLVALAVTYAPDVLPQLVDELRDRWRRPSNEADESASQLAPPPP